MIGNVCLRPVGTRGGRGEGWGPCACPRGMTSGLGSVRPTGLIPTRTSTRPPHPPHPTPCPYRMQDAPSPIRSAPFIRRRGRKRPNGYDYPIQLAKFIRARPAGDEELSRSFEPCLNNQHRSCHPERSEGSAQRSISVPSETDPSLRSG